MPPCVSLLAGLWRSADPQFEIAVHIEFLDEAVAALLVGGPRCASVAAAAEFPESQTLSL